MKRIAAAVIGSCLAVRLAVAASPSEGAWKAVDDVLGTVGKDVPGDVHRYGWPRTDLEVKVGDVRVEPALALGSWAAFKRVGNGERAMAMGDLVLLGSEVDSVARELESQGIEILAIHNHLIEETPRVMYLHFQGTADPSVLARALKAALARTKTPGGSVSGPSAQPAASASREKTFAEVQEVLGRKGSRSGAVLQLSVPRAEPIRDGGMEVPPSMGMATAINFQLAGERVASTGDLVLVADEVNPVIRELHARGIRVTALHSHMLRETPRLFFMHFWGVGPAREIAEGLKAALNHVAVVPTANH